MLELPSRDALSELRRAIDEVVSTRIVGGPHLEPVARLWVGIASNETVTPEQVQRLTEVGSRAAVLLERPSSSADQTS